MDDAQELPEGSIILEEIRIVKYMTPDFSEPMVGLSFGTAGPYEVGAMLAFARDTNLMRQLQGDDE